MKKVICVGLMMLGVLFFYGNTIAGDKKDNFLSLRYEIGQMKEGTDFQGTSNVFDNNFVKDWFFGGQLVTGSDDFKLIIPHVFRKIGQGKWQVGAKYYDSNYDKKLGPSIRFFGFTPLKTFTSFTATCYFDLEGNQNKVDMWLKMTKNFGHWQVGSEAWYYQTFDGGSENLHIRPIRVGYKIGDNIMPFVMIQRKWSDNGTQGDSVLIGMEFKF